MKEIHQVKAGDTYKLADDQARAENMALARDLNQEIENRKQAMTGFQYIQGEQSNPGAIISPVVVVAPGVSNVYLSIVPTFGVAMLCPDSLETVGTPTAFNVYVNGVLMAPFRASDKSKSCTLYHGHWYSMVFDTTNSKLYINDGDPKYQWQQ